MVVDLDPLGQGTSLLSEVRYWAVGNINNCDFDSGEVITDYLRPTPLENSGPHRFIYLLFKRSARITFEEPFITST